MSKRITRHTIVVLVRDGRIGEDIELSIRENSYESIYQVANCKLVHKVNRGFNISMNNARDGILFDACFSIGEAFFRKTNKSIKQSVLRKLIDS